MHPQHTGTRKKIAHNYTELNDDDANQQYKPEFTQMNRLTWWKNLLNNCYFFFASRFWPTGYLLITHVRNANWWEMNLRRLESIKIFEQLLNASVKLIEFLPNGWIDWKGRDMTISLKRVTLLFANSKCHLVEFVYDLLLSIKKCRFWWTNFKVIFSASSTRRSFFDYIFS